MTEEQAVRHAWDRIERWLEKHLPHAIKQLNPPATEDAIAAAEEQIGISFPAPLRASFLIHDGDGWMPQALPDGHWLLPLEETVQYWHSQKDLADPRESSLEENAPAWREWVESGTIILDGPVKPIDGSRFWIPLTSMNGDIVRYLDFDPPPGGVPGQVIEVDLEGMTWRVLAPSFLAFLEGYADDLEQGRYTVTEHGIETAVQETLGTSTNELPAYLQTVTIESYVPVEDPFPSLDALPSDEEITLTGEMGWLIGGPETIFSLHSNDGTEYVVLATPALTKGYSGIRVQQHARITAKRYTGEPESQLMNVEQVPEIHLLALDYTLLR